MDWKRIMNKKKRQQDRTEKTAASEAGHVVTEEEINQYLTRLLPEWNLRLLTDTDASANVILWVESVTVTAYQSAPETELSGKPNMLRLPERMRKCLMGLRASLAPLRNKI